MPETEKATFAGGCFWCVEAAFKEIRGVESAVSGYTGGDKVDPSYQEVCSGGTGHAEAVQVEYDPATVSYRDLLEVFFKIHDPTTKDRQGPDVGSQYRSAVYYHDDEQRQAVEDYIDELQEDLPDPIVTEVEPLMEFYVAEDYHQDYFENNPEQAYCRVNVAPKVEKVRREFGGITRS